MVVVACDVFLKFQIRSRDFGKLIISIVPLAVAPCRHIKKIKISTNKYDRSFQKINTIFESKNAT